MNALQQRMRQEVAESVLADRPCRSADHAAEARALVSLARLFDSPSADVLDALARTALGLCRADSVGVVVWSGTWTSGKEGLRRSASREGEIEWWATAGRWVTTPDYGPRAFDAWDRRPEGPVLLTRRHEDSVPREEAPFRVHEALVVPFPLDTDAPGHGGAGSDAVDANDGDPVSHVDPTGETDSAHHGGYADPAKHRDHADPGGALWLVSHDDAIQFDAEDLRLATSLSAFASAACRQRRQVAALADRARAEVALTESEAALREAEEVQRLALEAGQLGVWELDLLTETSPVRSPRHDEIFGYSEPIDDWSLERFLAHVLPGDRARVARTFQEAFRKGTWQFDCRIIRTDGEERWITARGQFFYEEGVPVRAIGVVQDTTERRRREEHSAFLDEVGEALNRLASPEEIMRAVGEKLGRFLGLAICSFLHIDDEEDQARLAHAWRAPGAARIPGTIRLGEFVRDDFHKASRAGRSFVVNDVTADPRTDGRSHRELGIRSFVSTPFHREGRWEIALVVCDSQPRHWRDDEIWLIRELANRIFPRLERARAEKAVRDAAERDQFRVELADALWEPIEPEDIARAGARVLRRHFDTGAVVFQDYPFEEGVEPVVESDDAAAAPSAERIVSNQRGEPTWITVPLLKNGRIAARLKVETPASRDWPPEEIALIRETADRTWTAVQQARTDRALHEAMKRAEAANEAKGRFLATMSHELRTPLSSVIGYTDLLKSEVLGPLAPVQHEKLSRVERSARHLVTMIDEILTYARAEADREEVRYEDADLGEITREVEDLVESQAQEKGLRVQTRNAEGVVPISTDPGKVRRILLNLAGNAIRYTDEGEITLEVDGSGSDAFRVHVHDTGPGIDPEDHARIFEAFTQVAPSSTPGTAGTGLGLAICRRLARLLDGDVTLESTPGEGCTFTLQLPRRPDRVQER